MLVAWVQRYVSDFVTHINVLPIETDLLVLLEALASGMPIITTENTAAPDLITNGREGFLLPAGDAEALREALESFTRQRVDIDAMSVAARKCAQSFTWDRYGERWASILKGN